MTREMTAISPPCSATRNSPSHRAMTPISPSAISTARLAISKLLAIRSENTSGLLPDSHCQRAAMKARKKKLSQMMLSMVASYAVPRGQCKMPARFGAVLIYNPGRRRRREPVMFNKIRYYPQYRRAASRGVHLRGLECISLRSQLLLEEHVMLRHVQIELPDPAVPLRIGACSYIA